MTRRATSGNIPEKYAAIRVGKYKLITGQPGRGDWYGTDPSLVWKAKYIMGPDVTDYDLLETGGPFGDMRLGDGGQAKIKREKLFRRSDFEKTIKTLWLFDLEMDPAEHNDIAAQHPDIVESLKARLEKYRKTMVTPLLVVPNRLWTRKKSGTWPKGEERGSDDFRFRTLW